MTVHPDNRSRILAAARDAFVDNTGAIEMNDIARRAGVSVGLAYHHFGSKAGLVSALIATFYDRYDAIVNQRLDLELPWHVREYTRISEAVAFLFEEPLAPIMLGKLSGTAEVMAVEASRRASIIEGAARNIRYSQERGEIDAELDAGIAAAVITGGLREAVARVLTQPGSMSAEDFMRQAWAFIARVVGVTASASGETRPQSVSNP
jgi:AcrR family transcriptional regulator